jgi:hypothetical protein
MVVNCFWLVDSNFLTEYQFKIRFEMKNYKSIGYVQNDLKTFS